jgi:hypothetical protein
LLRTGVTLTLVDRTEDNMPLLYIDLNEGHTVHDAVAATEARR